MGCQVSLGKKLFNLPNIVLISWRSIPCVLCVYSLSKVVGHYYMSVLLMSVMGFQKKWIGRELYPF